MDLSKYDGHNKDGWVNEQGKRWVIKTVNGEVIAKTFPWEILGTRQEDVANLNLMTDAPELLKYIEQLLKRVSYLEDQNDLLRYRLDLLGE